MRSSHVRITNAKAAHEGKIERRVPCCIASDLEGTPNLLTCWDAVLWQVVRQVEACVGRCPLVDLFSCWVVLQCAKGQEEATNLRLLYFAML